MIEENIRDLAEEEFREHLPYFYTGVKTKGTYCSATTLLTLRSSLNQNIDATRVLTFCTIKNESLQGTTVFSRPCKEKFAQLRRINST